MRKMAFMNTASFKKNVYVEAAQAEDVATAVVRNDFNTWIAYKIKSNDHAHLSVSPSKVGLVSPNSKVALEFRRLDGFDKRATLSVLVERRTGPIIGVFGKDKEPLKFPLNDLFTVSPLDSFTQKVRSLMDSKEGVDHKSCSEESESCEKFVDNQEDMPLNVGNKSRGMNRRSNKKSYMASFDTSLLSICLIGVVFALLAFFIYNRQDAAHVYDEWDE